MYVFTQPFSRPGTAGFTLVELVVVLLLIGILAAVALPRFTSFDNRTRLAAAQTTTGHFTESVSLLHGEWLLAGKPDSLVIDGATVEFTSTGWPTSAASGTAACLSIWNQVLKDPPGIVQYLGGGEPQAWSALGAGSFCLFIHQYGQAYTGSNLQPFFLYQPVGDQLVVTRYNMT